MSVPPDFPDDLRAPEQTRQQAMLEADTATLATVLHDDLVYIHSNGMSDSKASHLAGIAGGVVQYTALAMTGVRHVNLGPQAWLLSGRLQATATVAGNTIPIDAAFTAVWTLQPVWQMVSWQSTPWPRPAGS